jgi:hypothetical protein
MCGYSWTTTTMLQRRLHVAQMHQTNTCTVRHHIVHRFIRVQLILDNTCMTEYVPVVQVCIVFIVVYIVVTVVKPIIAVYKIQVYSTVILRGRHYLFQLNVP